jgi:hypothetical protein
LKRQISAAPPPAVFVGAVALLAIGLFGRSIRSAMLIPMPVRDAGAIADQRCA